jgi:uncharacterized glyoxalase superfamily protein PhnB
MTDPYRPKGLSSAVCYQDAKAAFRWLEQAFGFRAALRHSRRRRQARPFRDDLREFRRHGRQRVERRSYEPEAIGGKNTQTVHVQLAEGEDIDAQCERARRAGADILQQPETQFYGDRTYRARDPEGYIWTFGVTVQRMTPQEWDKASGLTTRKRLD